MGQQSQSNQTTEEMVMNLFLNAVDAGASDLHIEPHEDRVAIRYRVDGLLQERFRLPIAEYPQVLNTIKVMANLDITEHFIPADGHLEIHRTPGGGAAITRIDDSESQTDSSSPVSEQGVKDAIDVRVSIFPSINGHVVVARLLDRSDALRSIGELGLSDESLEHIKKLLVRSSGIFLITGPTGSGKTTMLYSFLNELKSAEKNVMTIEDPVEFHVDWMRQGEIHEARGFTYEAAMRSILRQDPDVLMIGEIRDASTAEYAMRSALVGRVVVSTVHANSVVGTIARLIDMKVDRSMIAYSLNGVMSQRLVRTICPYCAVDDPVPNAFYAQQLGLDLSQVRVRKGAGCAECSGTGYKKRMGVFSVFVFDDEMRSLIIQGVPMADLQAYALKAGMKTLRDDVVDKIKAGKTTLDEAIKVI